MLQRTRQRRAPLSIDVGRMKRDSCLARTTTEISKIESKTKAF